jgi:hypothetical protein
VRKRVLRVSFDRRAPFAPDELPPFEPVQRLLELADFAAADRRERPRLEDLADDGGILE